MGVVVGLVGFANSGKDTVATTLVNEFNFMKDSWAAPLKDATAAVFGWPRDMLEGATKESRLWREQIDEWWANRLGMPQLTPRWVLQYFGTEVFRNGFHEDIWVASLERRAIMRKSNIVVTDCRFPNEIATIRNLNGLVCRIRRGEDPGWFANISVAMRGSDELRGDAIKYLQNDIKIHPSEFMWIGSDVDYTIDNFGTLEQLVDSARGLAQCAINKQTSVFPVGQSAPTQPGVMLR